MILFFVDSFIKGISKQKVIKNVTVGTIQSFSENKILYALYAFPILHPCLSMLYPCLSYTFEAKDACLCSEG